MPCGFSFPLILPPTPSGWEFFGRKKVENVRQRELAAQQCYCSSSQSSCRGWGMKKAEETSLISRVSWRGGRLHHTEILEGIFSPLCGSRGHNVPCWARTTTLGPGDGWLVLRSTDPSQKWWERPSSRCWQGWWVALPDWLTPWINLMTNDNQRAVWSLWFEIAAPRYGTDINMLWLLIGFPV